MKYENFSRRSLLAPLALLLLLVVLLPSLLSGQTDPFDLEEEPSEIIANPNAPEDPGYDGDTTPAVDLATFGQPLLEGTLDADIAVEELNLPEGLVPLGPSQTLTPATCEGWTNPVTPLGIRASDGHYFTYNQQPILLVGVSADCGCHLDLEDKNVCSYGTLPGIKPVFPQNYPQIFADLKAKGLNKIRLWVALGRDPNAPSLWNNVAKQARNQPFQREGSYYRLDLRNDDFFNRLREVVIAAKKLDLFVEVTFFSPFQGKSRSLWLASDNLAKAMKADGSGLESVGFTDQRWAALKTTSSRPADNRMRDFQKNVIDWTVRWLWCYDNVYWEIANEPERQDMDTILTVQWQQQMIAYVRLAEDAYRSTAQNPGLPLKARHPVAVQPFTDMAVEILKVAPPAGAVCGVTNPANCRPDVLNGHYTQVKTATAKGFPGTIDNQLNLGAIAMGRKYYDVKKVLGLNEDNITPYNGAKGTRTLKTDVVPFPPNARDFGVPDPVRAEAWEFLLGGGGAFDHFGYIYDSTNGIAVRKQLGQISTYLTTKFPVFSLVPSTPVSAGAVWADVGAYPVADSWDSGTLSRKFWAAMESPNWQNSDTGRKFILYIHHSTPHCKEDLDDFAFQDDGRLKCKGLGISFDAYDGRRRPSMAKRYQEMNLRLHLGSKPGSFIVYWLDPTNPSGNPLFQETIDWKTSPIESCNNRTPCTITSPKYPYDILLRIVR